MNEYFSAYNPEEMADMKRDEVKKVLGVRVDGVLIQPPRCRTCHNYMMEIDLGDKFLQCPSCGAYTREYQYKDTMFKRGRVHGKRVGNVR